MSPKTDKMKNCEGEKSRIRSSSLPRYCL